MTTAIGVTKGIKRKINRTQIVWGTRYMKHQKVTSTICLIFFHITLYKQRYTYTCFIMCFIPKLFAIICNLLLCQTIGHKAPILFLNPQHQITTIGIGKCRKRTPKGLRKTSLSRLIFYLGTFLQLQSGL